MGILDRLEQNEFIERRADPTDRRNKLVFLTERGRSMESTLDKKMAEMNEEIMSGFDASEVKHFKKMLFNIGLCELKKR